MRFNPKAKIDNSQIVDRTPTEDDIRQRMMGRGKYAISSRGGRTNLQMEALRRRLKKQEPI